MKVIVVYKHYVRDECILGVYTDKNRAKRSATEQGYDPDKVKYVECEINDGIVDEVKMKELLTFAKIRKEYLENAKD